jgi:glycine cleavage system H lipoate-binding protein
MELQPSGSVRVGLDDFINRAVGRIDRVKLLLSGSDSRVKQGQPMLEVEQAGKVVVLPSPVSGTVSASNRTVEARPRMLSEAPYQNWVYSIAPTRLGQELLSLKIADSATSWLKGEVDRFTQWLTNLGAGQGVPALADGGLPTVGVLGELQSNEWRAFQEQFLSVGQEQQV